MQIMGKLGRRAFLQNYLSGESIDHKQITALFTPLLIDQAFILCLNLVNVAMISSSGVAAVSAVNMIDSINMFLISVFVAVATGGTVVVAQYKGSGNEPMVTKAAANAIMAVFLLSLTISIVVAAFYHPILRVLFGKASEDVFSNASVYLIGCCVSYVGIAVEQAVCGVLRGVGKTRVTLGLSLIMNSIYVALNFVFINGMGMGVLGMVIAINIARYFAAFCAIYYMVRMSTTLRLRLAELFHFQIDMLRKVLFIGVPYAAEQMFFHSGKIITQVFIVSLGTYAIATNAIGGVLAGLSQIPANALALTLVTVVGQCVGRRNVGDARKLTKSILWISTGSFVLMALVILALFRPLVAMFHPPEEIVPHIYTITLINLIAQVPLWAISFLLPASLRAAGDSRFTSVTSMISMWMFRVVLGYIFGIVMGFGIVGIWVAMNIEWGVRGSVFLWRFIGEKWYAHRLIESTAGD